MTQIEKWEARYKELVRTLTEMDWEISTAKNFECYHFIPDEFHDFYGRCSEELAEIGGMLEAAWKVDPNCVSKEFADMFEEWKRVEEGLNEMGWFFNDEGYLEAPSA